MGKKMGHSDYVKRIQELRLIDDTFFNAFMEDNAKDMELFLRVILEMNGKRFDDKAGIIYVNASCQDDKTELGRLMYDMFCTRPEDMYHQELAERARYLKTDEHGVMKMCKMMEEIHEDGRAEGKAEGIAETTFKIVRNLLSSGKMSYEEIAENADTSIDEVLRIAKESHLVY